MQKDVKLACFPDFKVLILEHLIKFDEFQILHVDGDIDSKFDCRVHHFVWIVSNKQIFCKFLGFIILTNT